MFPGLNPGDRFDIARQPLFQPVLIVRQGSQGGMDQLVGDDPVGRRVLPRWSILPDAQAQKCREAVPIAPGRALQHAVSAGDRDDQDTHARNREAAVVDESPRGRQPLNALHDLVAGKVERPFGEVDLQSGPSNINRLGEHDAMCISAGPGELRPSTRNTLQQ